MTQTFTLVVTANPDFVLSEPSAFPEVNLGSTGVNGPISIASQDGFASTVTLSCSSGYGAESCSISPTSVNSFPATVMLTINGTSFTAGGAYSVSVVGTSGSSQHSLPVAFNVGDFSITGMQSLSLIAGQQGTANLQWSSVASYAGNINAICDASAIRGAQCVLYPHNPIAVARGGSTGLTVTLNIPTDATPGTYGFKINLQDAGGAPSHTFAISVQLGDYSISGTQTVSGTAGAQVAANLQLNPLFGYSGQINASCDHTAAPAGTQCVLTPNPVSVPSGGSAGLTVTINIPNDANPGTYPITVNTSDTRGAPSHSFSISLTVNPDFVVTSTPGESQTVAAGQTTGPYALTVQPVGTSYNSPVTLSCSGLPAGAQCSFSPSGPVTPGNSAADVVMSISTSASGVKSKSLAATRIFSPTAFWLPLVGIALGAVISRKRIVRARPEWAGCVTICLAMLWLLSCAGVSSAGGGGGGAKPVLTVSFAGNGRGTVTGNGVNCASSSSSCSMQFAAGTNLTLTATGTAPASSFGNWGGCDSTSGADCTLNIQNDVIVTATFNPTTYHVTVTGTSQNISKSATVTLIVN